MSDVKAQGTVIIRHTCDGRQTAADQTRRQLVYKDRHGRYYIKLLTRRWPVLRIEKTDRFVCEFAGRTGK